MIWRLSDGKRGHDNQSLGLVRALSRLTATTVHDIPAPSRFAAFLGCLAGTFAAGAGLPAPDLIVGAGHGTHLPMLAARRARGGRIAVLMKPSLPLACFDLCLIPRHDGSRAADNVIVTEGALNTIVPSDRHDEHAGLILVGGVSRHYRWDDAAALAQIRGIVGRDRATAWLITDSRRTPASAVAALRNLQAPNVAYRGHLETGPDWLPQQLARCGKVWVTEDSVSMIHEALTAGGAVGLIAVPIAKVSRISRAVRRLLEERSLTAQVDWLAGATLKPPRTPLDESTRCARLVLERLRA